MQRSKLFGSLIAGLCLVTGTIASSEPATKPPPKKHPECEGSKIKTACNNAADVKEFVTGLQAQPPGAGPTVPADQTVNPPKSVQPATDEGAQTPQ